MNEGVLKTCEQVKERHFCFMTLIKRSILFIVIVFAGLFTWANWDAPQISTSLPSVNLVIFQLKESFPNISEKVKALEGVNALALNETEKTLTVVYEIEKYQINALTSRIENLINSDLKLMEFNDDSQSCPVKAPGFIKKVHDFFCIRAPKNSK